MGGTDEQIEAALLFLVLDLEPGHLSTGALVQKMSTGNPDSRAEEQLAVERAIASLRRVGLLDERDGRIAPTPAAVRFNALYI